MDDKEDRLKVSLSNPQDGWIEFEINTTEEAFKEAVSYTPNDFILELATALSLAMQGADGMAVASCEPIAYELTFSEVSARGAIRSHGEFAGNWKHQQGVFVD